MENNTPQFPNPIELCKQASVFAYKNFWQFFAFVVPLVVIVGLIEFSVVKLFPSLFLTSVPSASSFSPLQQGLFLLLFSIVIVAVELIFFGSIITYIVKKNKGETMSVMQAYRSGVRMCWKLVCAMFIMQLIVGAGSALLILPGIALMVYLVFFSFTVIDGGYTDLDALVASFVLVRGSWWKTVWYYIALVLGLVALEFVGFISLSIVMAIGVGLGFVLGPVTSVLLVIFTVAASAAFIGIIIFVFGMSLDYFYLYYKNLKLRKAHTFEAEFNKVRPRARKVFGILAIVGFFGVVAFYTLGGNTAYMNYIESFQAKIEKVQLENQAGFMASSTPFHSTVGAFSIKFPGQPTVSTKDSATGVGNSQYTTYLFQKEVSRSLSFQVAYINFPTTIDITKDPKAELISSMNGAVQNSGATIVSSQLGTYHGYPSNDYLGYMANYNLYVKSRTILKGQNFYDLIVSYSKDADSDKNSAAADDFLNSFSLDGQTGNVVDQMANPTIATSLQKMPYTSIGQAGFFQINLPTGWSFSNSTTTDNLSVDMISNFYPDHGQSVIAISKLDMANIRRTMSNSTDAAIATSLSQAGVATVKDQFTSLGLKGFQASDLKKQVIGADTGYVYRGSASFGPPQYATYDFEVVTIFNGQHGYQILMVWPESEYGWAANILMQSIATFTASD